MTTSDVILWHSVSSEANSLPDEARLLNCLRSVSYAFIVWTEDPFSIRKYSRKVSIDFHRLLSVGTNDISAGFMRKIFFL